MGHDIQSICVFCSASDAVRDRYRHMSDDLSVLFADQGWDVVYGGSVGGLMGLVADASLDRGLRVTGVIPESLKDKEIAHTGLSQLITTQDMHERQLKMAEFSDAFLVLPGGLGTMAEMFEVVTWFQLGLHQKPCFILNLDGYWDPLLAQLDKAEAQGFVHGRLKDFILTFESLEAFKAHFL